MFGVFLSVLHELFSEVGVHKVDIIIHLPSSHKHAYTPCTHLSLRFPPFLLAPPPFLATPQSFFEPQTITV